MSGPVNDLRKHEDDVAPMLRRIDAWALRHANILLPLCFITLLLLFVALCFAIVGPSGTESGLQYNHLQDVIL